MRNRNRNLLRALRTQEKLKGDLQRASGAANSIVTQTWLLITSPLLAAYEEEIDGITKELLRIRRQLKDLRERDAAELEELNAQNSGDDDE